MAANGRTHLSTLNRQHWCSDGPIYLLIRNYSFPASLKHLKKSPRVRERIFPLFEGTVDHFGKMGLLRTHITRRSNVRTSVAHFPRRSLLLWLRWLTVAGNHRVRQSTACGTAFC